MSDVEFVINSPGTDFNNQANGALALFLTQFGGECLTAYRRARKTIGRHLERSIKNGKAADFPVLGRKVAKYLNRGQSLDAIREADKQTVKKIFIDGLLTADCLIFDLDDAMLHYDVSSEYAAQIGEALAMAADGGVLAEIAKLAVSETESLPGLGKSKIIKRSVADGLSAESEELGKAIVAEVLAAKTLMSNNYVPNEGRVCYMLPVAINAMVAAKDVINKEFGAVATITDATVTRLAGMEIVEVPALTVGGVTSSTGEKPDGIVQGDGHVFPKEYKDTCAFLVAHRSTVGTLTLRKFEIEHARRTEYQADEIVGKYQIGHGGLRPESAVMGVITTTAEAASAKDSGTAVVTQAAKSSKKAAVV